MSQVDLTLWVDALEPQLSGVGRYTWELAQGLAEHPDIDRLSYFARNRLIKDPGILLKGGRPPRRSRLFGRLQSRFERRGLANDFWHGPNFFLPAFVKRGVITIHDLSVLRYPDTHPAARLREYAMLFEQSLGRASHIITVSNTVREEVIDLLQVAPERVTAVYNGVSGHFRPHEDERLDHLLGQWGLTPKGYGLCVAAIEPRKKLIELLDAWRDLPPPLRAAHPLVIAGAPGWNNDRILERIEQGAREGWLYNLGYVPERFLPALFAGASLFVYPSTYEGFGLPPIEAMASGVPVIVSDKSCLPEVAGAAARLVDPDDHDAFLLAVEECLTNEQWRTGAVARGLEHAARFDWRRTVEETVAVYRKALAAS